MYNKMKKYRVIATIMLNITILGLFGDKMVFANPTHGTSSRWINESELNNTPPKDYKINEKTQGKARDKKYNEYFLDNKLQEVYIEIDENNLDYLLQNAKEAPYVMADSVTIGDTKIEYAGLKTKGDYTLIHSYDFNEYSDRFSFTVNFGKYINKSNYGEKQTFFGCEKISFNNLFFDKSMLKEFVAYKLMDEMGLPVPQYGLAKLYINNQYYGVYFMVEAMEETIIEQYYGVKDVDGLLGKPRDTTLAYEQLLANPALICDNDQSNLEDYEEMIPTMLEWSKKLSNLSGGKDFEGKNIDINSEKYIELLNQIMDVEETVKYFAVHSWLCQFDSMFAGYKNYGIYISEDGVSTVLPWDYDLSFGCYGDATAMEVANYELDKMYIDGFGIPIKSSKKYTYQQFPMFNVIYQNEALMEMFYGYMGECSMIAALGGNVESLDRFYEPGYLNNCIENLEDELLEAARLKLSENVYYMNGISQPADMKDALPNIKKIIAYRAVGVKLQLDKVNSLVCATGCNLRFLGNGVVGNLPSGGNLTTVDEKTGIYVSAKYNNNGISPMITVTEMKTVDGTKVYMIKDAKEAEGQYEINIPVSEEVLNNGDIEFFMYYDNTTHKLNLEKKGNIYSGVTDKLGYLVIGNFADSNNINNQKLNGYIISIYVVVFMVIILLAILLGKSISKRKNKQIIIIIALLLSIIVVMSIMLFADKTAEKEVDVVEQVITNAEKIKIEPEVIVGTSWWEVYENSKSYMMIGDDSLEMEILVDENNASNNAFCVEIYDDGGRYFTTTSEGDAWYAGTDGIVTGTNKAKQLMPGMKIKVIVTRQGNEFTFEYYNEENKQLMQKIIAKENGKFSKNLKVRIMAQIGKYTVEEVSNKSDEQR